MSDNSTGRVLLLVILVFATLVGLANPVRQMLTRDDGWAYARSVEHLLETGEYRLDSWAAANMPTQIYLAAGLTKAFGYSLSLLRITTLLMLLCGAMALYGILCESGMDKSLAGVLTVALICNPIVFWLGFTFMTDVHFLGWVLVACWLSARALRSLNLGVVFASSLAAALATGTRIFGIAVTVGLIGSWFLTVRPRCYSLWPLLAGVAAPVAVFAWQVVEMSQRPTFTQSVRIAEQSQYLSQAPLQMIPEALWRCTVLIEYLGLFLLPVLPGLLLLFHERRPNASILIERKQADASNPYRLVRNVCMWLMCLFGAHFLGIICHKGTPVRRLSSTLMPNTSWVFGALLHGFPARASEAASVRLRDQFLLTLLACVSGAVWSAMLLRWSGLRELWRRRDPVSYFFTLTGLAFAALHLAYVQFHDTYFVVFLPFLLIRLAQILGRYGMSTEFVRVTAVSSIVIGVTVACWMRGQFNKEEAEWHAADQLHAAGLDTMQAGSSLTWMAYHGGFDEWLKGPGASMRPEEYAGSFHTRFLSWAADRQAEADYIVCACGNRRLAVDSREIVGSIEYLDALFRVRSVCTVRQRALEKSGKCCE